METGQLELDQQDRDRLLMLREAQKKGITQKASAERVGVSERQVRRLLRGTRSKGDKPVVHALGGLASNSRLTEKTRQEAMAIPSEPIYRGLGPTQASEYLRSKHQIAVTKETVRKWMTVESAATRRAGHSVHCGGNRTMFDTPVSIGSRATNRASGDEMPPTPASASFGCGYAALRGQFACP